MKKGIKGSPWTIHTSRACIKAKTIDIDVKCTTEYKPELPHNPKAFITTYANIEDMGNGHFRLS
jgi:hypothetical protein